MSIMPINTQANAFAAAYPGYGMSQQSYLPQQAYTPQQAYYPQQVYGVQQQPSVISPMLAYAPSANYGVSAQPFAASMQQPVYQMSPQVAAYPTFGMPVMQQPMVPMQPSMPMMMQVPQQQQWVNNFAVQNQYAVQGVNQIQQVAPAPIGELLGLTSVLGTAFTGTNLLSTDAGVTRALELLTGIPGGIPGYSRYGTNAPTYPQTRRWDGMFIGVNNQFPGWPQY